MQTDPSQSETSAPPEFSGRRPIRKVLTISRETDQLLDQSLEENLSSALQATDSDLSEILHEVDEISHLLRSENPDKKTLNIAAHPAVWSAVKQALLDRELRHLALTDDLTCLYNRRGFFAAATQLLKLACRNKQRLLLFFCDLDHLKEINDTYGHQEGDLALVKAADSLERTFRRSDVVARIGGDEFVVLAVETSDQSQEIILRRLHRNLKKANSPESRFQLSVSVGAARFDPQSPLSLGELMLQADKVMYEEKKRARKPSNVNSSNEPNGCGSGEA